LNALSSEQKTAEEANEEEEDTEDVNKSGPLYLFGVF